MPTINFTKKILADILVSDTRQFFQDQKVKELYFRVGKSGTRTFYYYKRISRGQPPAKFAIGKFPEMTIDQARRKALSISSGSVKVREAQAGRSDLTIAELMDLYREKHVRPNIKRPECVESVYRCYVQKTFSRREFGTITDGEIQDWVNELKMSHSIRTAYNSFALFRALIKWGLRRKYLHGGNPCESVICTKPPKRERFLQEDEIHKFLTACDKLQNQNLADVFRMCLWTGARSENVFEMEWNQIDLNSKLWMVPAGQTKEEHAYTVHLIEPAVNLLKNRPHDSKYVFTNSGTKFGHEKYPESSWKHIKKIFPDLWVHDLRRTHGSQLAIAGTSLPVIAAALGHKSLAATEIYARLTQKPVKDAVNRVAGVLSGK